MIHRVCATVKLDQARSRPFWIGATLVALTATLVFVAGVASEPHFPDESAFITQSYFLDLWFQKGRDQSAWLEYPALDLPPLPKYMIGLSLHARGYPSPGRGAALAWYGNVNRRFESDAMLHQARWPSVVCGALGCVAVYALGMLVGGRTLGVIAALLLMANPLYRLLARRAMADAPAEALILATAAVGLWAWQALLSGRWSIARTLGAAVIVGVLGGLAVLAKLNGGLGLMIVSAWTLLGLTLPGVSERLKGIMVGSTLVTGLVAFGTFVALNPFMTVKVSDDLPPELEQVVGRTVWARAAAVIKHRATVSKIGQDTFPHDALRTPLEKLKTVLIQGFGRFGPLGPLRHDSLTPYPRYDWKRDWGALIWPLWVALGAIWAIYRGRRQVRVGEPPTAWAVLLQACVALATVTAFIPLAWDRYLLSIQAGSALLAAGAVVAAVQALWPPTGRFKTGSD
ncbi:MAG: 4-amino-4-deoxy-L-arabinose transferase [Isosphaeraceae bacterium]